MTTATRSAAKTRPTPSHAYELGIDFPQRRDLIFSREYTFRIGASSGVSGVEVSIDEGPWQPCREAVGYWWFDWSNFGQGRHQLVARGARPDGREILTSPRSFEVDFEGVPAERNGHAG